MTVTDPYKEIHTLREKIAQLYDEYAGKPCEQIRHMEEVAELREENKRLQQLVTQRGARMQIMREFLVGIDEPHMHRGWKAFIADYNHPEAADWFDKDGVPK